ncbi:MAG TPA: bifunctional riboflavin kinase/FAD synthetase [Bacteroidales bacterium]|nr:bifunctional riboflavin kinase/FAD synthetase [Bacteroidales bacterium]
MKVYNDINHFQPVKNAIVTVGTFDGVHLGHQAIFRRMVEDAKKIGGQTVVVTFHPHPRMVLNIDSQNLRFITTQEQKLHLIEKTGIDHVIIIEFTRAFSRTSSEDFIKQFIVEKIKPARLVVGYDHHFGKNRMGDFKLLYDLSLKFNFKLERIPAQDVEHIAVSSTKIRKALEAGDVRRANKLLGYEYTICGTVIHGNAMGRKLGFPTANLAIDEQYKLIHATGVYACHVTYQNHIYPGMSNVGFRPTVGSETLTIETHIFGFEQEIYGEELCISFVDRIRDEKKFDTLEALSIQLAKDKQKALALLARHE